MSPRQDRSGLSPNWARPFFTIWTGQALSLVGSQVGAFALVWWLTKASGSATVLATASLVAMLPQVLLGPFVGALVDRWNRRRVMVVADTAIALLSAWLAYLFWAGRLQIWHVYLIMFARSLGGAFHWPAMQASTSLMVPKEQLSRVGGMNQTLQGVLGIVTPPLGAFAMEIMPLHTIMIIDVITAAFAIGPLTVVHIPQPERPTGPDAGPRPSLWGDVADGFFYIWHWKGMFLVLILATLINMMIHPGMSLLPMLVLRKFGGGALQLGWLNSAWGAGVILGGLILSVWGGFKRKVVTGLLGLIGQGIGFTIVGLTPGSAFWLGIVGLAVGGTMNPICNGPLFALLQDVVAPEMQGRVFTVIGSLSGLAAPVGLAIAGPVADWLGVQAWFVLGGVLCIVLGAAMFLTPTIIDLEAHGHAAQAARKAGTVPSGTSKTAERAGSCPKATRPGVHSPWPMPHR
jgi:DHA3 family macrolide efflux protein-like MFS transporter